MEKIRRYKKSINDCSANKENLEDLKNSMNSNLLYGSDFSKSTVVDYDGMEDSIVDDTSSWAKKHGIDTSKMSIKDYRNLLDDVAMNSYYGVDINNFDTREDLRRNGIESAKEDYDGIFPDGYKVDDLDIYRNKIEKKAFVTELWLGALTGGLAGSGAGNAINGIQGFVGPKSRKYKKEYKEFQKNPQNKKKLQYFENPYKFVNDNMDKIIEKNPNITYGDLENELKKQYLRSIK